ncbi:uncharacterized protein EAE98_003197 [Botrytis deweyae]|uniref:Uncharacterized protein n=1 Tax=Botrytis deweyae TaxID=2478750 RepID=A0ABQ7IWR4_9HELO|nr:uncharacterized protein EAE98_003197 [Botrytis deweyae]KAF7935152.1 hypothetical protein EAE98_003197 [Botrytis deweyae]
MRGCKATGRDVEARSDHDIADGSMTCNATTAAFLRAEDQDLSQVYKRAEDEDLSQVYKRAEDEDLSQVY